MNLLVYVVFALWAAKASDAQHTIAELMRFMTDGSFEEIASGNCTMVNQAAWNYDTNITTENGQKLSAVTLLASSNGKKIHTEWFEGVNLADIPVTSIRRQVMLLQNIGNAALPPGELATLTSVKNTMVDIYGSGKICPYTNQNCNLATQGLPLTPDIESIMAYSRDYNELTYVWKAWRDATGKKMRPDYKPYADLSNEAANLNGFADKGAMWRSDYETPNFEADMEALWLQVEPLYLKLHDYVRTKLIGVYGLATIGVDGLIPANILGNMWAQSWGNLADITTPYPDATTVDLTQALIDQGYTVLKMFETSNEFYMSMGLLNNNMSYGPGSMIVKPPGVEVVCHASAWDFCDKKTYRIKMCTQVDGEDFITIHHEMGHIQYFLQYANLPIAFRSGANPGFHEAIGDTIALSVATPQHLEKIGLLTGYVDSDESSLNALMNMALERVAFLPFGYLIDKWRWDLFAGTFSEAEWNAQWWSFRTKYQKIKPPVTRNESDFDAGAKYHVAADSQYINYFVAHILEFQLYRGLCIAAGQYDPVTKTPPLHKCDFYQNTAAGDKLRAGLELGRSQPWELALQAMTGETQLDASAILDYFKPLSDYFDSLKS